MFYAGTVIVRSVQAPGLGCWRCIFAKLERFLTPLWGPWTGNGGYGRLGHSVQQDEFTPKKVQQLTGRMPVAPNSIVRLPGPPPCPAPSLPLPAQKMQAFLADHIDVTEHGATYPAVFSPRFRTCFVH